MFDKPHDFINALSRRFAYFGSREAQDLPAVGAQPMIFSGILFLLFFAAVPVIAIALYSKAMLWQGYIYQPFSYFVLCLVLYMATLQFVNYCLLNAGRALLFGKSGCKGSAMTRARTVFEFVNLSLFNPNLFFTPLTSHLDPGKKWVIGSGNSALGFIRTGTGTISGFLCAAQWNIKGLTTNFAYLRKPGALVWRRDADMGRAQLLSVFCIARWALHARKTIFSKTGATAELTTPILDSVFGSFKFFAAFKAMNHYFAACAWAGHSESLLAKGIWRFESEGQARCQYAGFSEWLARPPLSLNELYHESWAIAS